MLAWICRTHWKGKAGVQPFGSGRVETVQMVEEGAYEQMEEA